MSNASVVFLPWVRQGFAARLSDAGPADGTAAAQAPLGGHARREQRRRRDRSPRASATGPADVHRHRSAAGRAHRAAGRHARLRSRTTSPRSSSTTPICRGCSRRPRPTRRGGCGRGSCWWSCASRTACGCARPRAEPLPVLEIAPPAVPADGAARSRRLVGMGACAARRAPQDATRRRSAHVLATRPELSVSRLLSPRLLQPYTDYIACVVPAFEAGPARRTGRTAADANAALAPAWTSGAQRAAQRLAAGVLPLGVPHRRARGLRIDRRAARAARFRRRRRPAPDGHQRAGFLPLPQPPSRRASCSKARCSRWTRRATRLPDAATQPWQPRCNRSSMQGERACGGSRCRARARPADLRALARARQPIESAPRRRPPGSTN